MEESNKDEKELKPQCESVRSQNQLSLPDSTDLKLFTPLKPISSSRDETISDFQNALNSVLEKNSLTEKVEKSPSRIPPPNDDLALTKSLNLEEKTTSRFAIRFFLKKSKRFYGAISLFLTKPTIISGTKLRNLITRLTKSVQTLTGSLRKDSTFSQITNGLSNAFKGPCISNSIRALGFYRFKSEISMNEISKAAKQKKKYAAELASKYSSLLQIANIQAEKEPSKQVKETSDFQFTKPKIYRCQHCDNHFFRLIAYLKHVRRYHQTEILKCEGCQKNFASPNNLKRHQKICRKKSN